MYTTHFLKSDIAAISREAQNIISREVGKIYEKVHNELNLPRCEVLISVNPQKIHADDIFLGFSYDQSAIYLFVDVEKLHQKMAITHDVIARNIAEHLYRSVYTTARTHHIGLDTDCGLLEEVINEGLSEKFVTEKMLTNPKSRYTQTPDKEIKRLWGKMKSEINQTTQDIEKWFWGKKEESIPPFAASAVGFAITNAYLKETQQKSVDALTTSAKNIVAHQKIY